MLKARKLFPYELPAIYKPVNVYSGQFDVVISVKPYAAFVLRTTVR